MATPRPTPPYELSHEPDGTSWTARENLHDILRRELLGPADGDEEVLEMPPDTRYLIGRIAPRRVDADGDAPSSDGDDDPDSLVDVGDDIDAKQTSGVPLTSVDDTAIDADEDGAEDAPVRRGLMVPASMGLRFQIPMDLDAFTVRGSWGTYEPQSTGEPIPSTDRDERVFRRQHHDHTVTVRVAELAPGQTAEYTFDDAVKLRVDSAIDHCAEHPERTRRILEIALCNDRETPRRIPVNAWMFQTELDVTAGDQAVFLPVHDPLLDPERPTDDEELKRLDLQYRDLLEFAIGRTCSATWLVDDGQRRARRVSTTWIPTSDTPPTQATETPGVVRDMKALAAADIAGLDAGLRPIVDGYAEWLKDKAAEAETLPPHLRGTALDALDQAHYVHRHLSEGLDYLLDPEHDDARRCFAFMNTVMAEQRIRSQVASERASHPDLSIDAALATVEARGAGAHSWRTFQLAFVLMQIPGLCNPAHPRRSGENTAAVELLFFPTGGGKTEAYLGLAAFAFAIRRLQGRLDTPDGVLDGGAGVTVLMRYTLRLLTAQQFQRATALVCAAEIERRKDEATWGAEPFRIGLWVGSSVSPKYVDEAAKEKEAFNDKRRSKLSVLQIKRCPWCGTPITPAQVEIDTTAGRVYVRCGDDLGECPFAAGGEVDEGLPVLTVDEEIYRLAPAFVIATVDKFARLAREGAAASLFGYVSAHCERHGYAHPDDKGCKVKVSEKHPRTGALQQAHKRPCDRLRPPDLIIQDELHLITGALGTTVGLFEMVIDALTTWRTPDGATAKPLIVASTATVRNAQQQARGLYGRDPILFPPRVLDAGDTYFSREVPITPSNPGRRYVGLSTTGVRFTTAEIRVAEVLMAAAQLLLDKGGKDADPYMTLVGYYSATRELAGMKRYMGDDIQTALAKGRRGIGLPRRPGSSYGVLNVDELTSRVSGTDITDTLDRMAIGFDPGIDSSAARQQRRELLAAGQPITERSTDAPYDAVLATSMLQVGVDVSRLGLMLMAGQPKNTAEYIQASSRVGRDASRPGLVVTLGNWARPRDLAHYEGFQHYHETFYSQVEPLSVTPFSVTALERGLAGVLVSALRVLDSTKHNVGLSPEYNAGRITDSREVAERLIDSLVARAVAASGDPLTEDAVRTRLLNDLDTWDKRKKSVIKQNKTLAYEKFQDTSRYAALLRSAEDVDSRDDARVGAPFIVANSMREVQPDINLLVSPKPENLMWTDDGPDWAPQPAGSDA